MLVSTLTYCRDFAYAIDSGMFAPLKTFLNANIAAIHYTVRIFIGSGLLWAVLHNQKTTNSLWAIISLIVVTEPQVHPAWVAVRTIIVNTFIGCSVALACLLTIGIHIWLLPLALSMSAFISAIVNKMQQGWKNAPTTTVIIMSAAMTQKSAIAAFDTAMYRTGEVVIGGVTALLVTRLVAAFWLPEKVDKT